MKFFKYDPQTDEQVTHVMKLVKLRKNGEAAELMSRGLNVYPVSYGVSINHLKEIAASFEKNNEIAERLVYREVREAQIVSTLLADVDQLPVEQCLEWCEQVKTPEMVEQMSLNVLSKHKRVVELSSALLKQNNQFSIALAYYSMGRAIQHSVIDETVVSQLFAEYVDVIPTIQLATGAMGASFYLRQVARLSFGTRQLINNWLIGAKKNDSIFLKKIIEEVTTELDWIAGNNQ